MKKYIGNIWMIILALVCVCGFMPGVIESGYRLLSAICLVLDRFIIGQNLTEILHKTEK